MRVNKCCGCLSVYFGAMFLGYNALLLNLIELVDFIPTRCYVNLALSPIFLLVVFSDTPFTRKLWFHVFVVYETFNVCFDWPMFAE